MKFEIGDIVKCHDLDIIGTIIKVTENHYWVQLPGHWCYNQIAPLKTSCSLVRTKRQETMCRHFAELGVNGRELLQDLKAVVGMNADTEFERIYKDMMKAAI